MLDQLIKQAKLTTQSTEFNNQAAKDKFYFSYAWRKKREYILEFYNFECQVCKSEGGVTLNQHSKMIAHHIKVLEYFPELRLTDSNLILVCFDCHNLIHEQFSSIYADEWW